ncbi:hypothetical protein Tco_0364879 [Tanacetum coccineum]
MQAARDRQKRYADKRRRPLEFEVGDKVMLKVAPWKGVMRFGKHGKLNPRYIGPFQIIERIGPVAYRLELPQELSRVHNVFHVFNLKKCLSDDTLVIPLEEIQLDDKLNFVEEPVEIMVPRDIGLERVEAKGGRPISRHRFSSSSLGKLVLGSIGIDNPCLSWTDISQANTVSFESDYGCPSEIVKSLGVSFDLSPRQKAVVECLRAPRAQNFLTVIPNEGLGQHMSALEYRTILKYQLMIPLFPVDEPCPVCRKVCLDSFGEHAVHCKELPGFKYRHDLVRDVLYDVLKRAGISSRKEAPVNFLTDPLEGRSTLRPADILVFGWAGGKHACVDLTGVSPLVGLRDNGFVAGQAALKEESSKVAKHEKACLENQHVFIPFAFDTFGFLAPEADGFLNRVQRVVQSNFSTPKTQNFIFSRIGFVIQKEVAAQLVARLPAILL